MAVGVGGGDVDGFSDLGLGEDEGLAAAEDVCVLFPGVGDRAQAIGVNKGVGRGESLAWGRSAANRDAAGGQVVEVGYSCCGCRSHGFGGAMTVGVGGCDGDGFADLGLCENEGGASA